MPNLKLSFAKFAGKLSTIAEETKRAATSAKDFHENNQAFGDKVHRDDYYKDKAALIAKLNRKPKELENLLEKLHSENLHAINFDISLMDESDGVQLERREAIEQLTHAASVYKDQVGDSLNRTFSTNKASSFRTNFELNEVLGFMTWLDMISQIQPEDLEANADKAALNRVHNWADELFNKLGEIFFPLIDALQDPLVDFIAKEAHTMRIDNYELLKQDLESDSGILTLTELSEDNRAELKAVFDKENKIASGSRSTRAAYLQFLMAFDESTLEQSMRHFEQIFDSFPAWKDKEDLAYLISHHVIDSGKTRENQGLTLAQAIINKAAGIEAGYKEMSKQNQIALDFIDLLRKYHIDLTAKNHSNETALFYVKPNQFELAKFLINAGVDLMARDNDSNTAYDVLNKRLSFEFKGYSLGWVGEMKKILSGIAPHETMAEKIWHDALNDPAYEQAVAPYADL